MTEWLRGLDPVLQAVLAGTFTWSVTAAGAAVVLLYRGLPRRLLDSMLGFAAGVMIAASFFSLLLPAIEMADATGTPPWIPATVGFVAGAIFLRGADAVLFVRPLLPYAPLGFAIMMLLDVALG